MDNNFVNNNLKIEWETIKPYYDELAKRPVNNVEELKQWLRDRSQLEGVLEEDMAWRYIKMTCNTEDETLLQSYQYFINEITPHIAPASNALDKKLADSPYAEQLTEPAYRILYKKVKNAIELFRQENIALQTEEQLLAQEYQGITGSLMITYKGESYTINQAARFLKDNDRTVRQQVWQLIQDERLKHKAQLDELFNKLLKVRHQIAVNAGFNNYRDYMFKALNRFDYTVDDCLEFHEAIKEVMVPVLQKQAAEKAEKLGLAAMRPWDTDADPGQHEILQPSNNGDDLVNKCIANFNALNPRYGQVISDMKKRGFFDIDSRKGKAPGGYNYPLSVSGAAFIFMNNANLMRDLTTMVHEGGHALHSYFTAALELNDFKHCPSEVAELASMSMELLSMRNWDVYFTNAADLKRARAEQMADVLKTFPWVAVVDSFQHWIYTHPEHTAAERDAMFKNIFEQYGAGMADWQGLQQYEEILWQKQLHIYEVPFYYIEYAIAQLGAIGVYKNFVHDADKALADYTAALELGYTQPINKIYERAGVNFAFNKAHVQQLTDFVTEQAAAYK